MLSDRQISLEDPYKDDAQQLGESPESSRARWKEILKHERIIIMLLRVVNIIIGGLWWENIKCRKLNFCIVDDKWMGCCRTNC